MRRLNYKNDFFDDSKFLQLDKGFFLWPETFEFSEKILNALPFCNSTIELFNRIVFSNSMFISEDSNVILFLRSLKQHEYSDLATSVIFYYLKSQYKKYKILNFIDWEKLVFGLLNPKITDSIMFFLEEFDVMNFLLETENQYQFLSGVTYYFGITATATKKSEDLKEIKNLLKFLKVDQSLIDCLLEKTYNENNFESLMDFLMKYRFNT